MAGGRARGARPGAPPRSQHFLRSPRLAAELVRAAGIRPSELVVEIGAGDGRLTAELARASRHVLAVEVDPTLAAALRRRLASADVSVVHADALSYPLPREQFRVFGNIPFHVTNAILRRLLEDPGLPISAADLVVQWGVARKRAEVWPSTLAGVVWGAYFVFAIERRLPAACFVPRPSVDTGVLSIRRRSRPLIGTDEAASFRRFVRTGFARPLLRESLRTEMHARAFNRIADSHGFSRRSSGRDLDVHQWTALFHAASR